MSYQKCFMIAGLAILFMSSAAIAQPDTLWTQTYGGTGIDVSYSVQQTDDGGYIIVGETNSYGAGSKDVYLIKTNELGNELWTQTYGGTGTDVGRSVQQTQDGGYIIAGDTYSYGAGGDVYLIKTDASGNSLWYQNYGGTSTDYGYSVQQTDDGSYIIAGYTISFSGHDVYLIKTDASGDTLWTQTYGGGSIDHGYSVQQTTDGGYVIAGYTASYGAGFYDVYLIKTDEFGNELWYRTFGGSSNDHGYSVQQTSDGGYIIVGYTDSYGAGGSDVYLIKTDVSGNTLWTQIYGGSLNDDGQSVQQTPDGGYIIAGNLPTAALGYNVYLIKTNESGIEEWTQTYGGAYTDKGYSIQLTQDGGYIVAGCTFSYGAGSYDFYLIRLEGEVLPDLSVTLTPYNPPIQIPANGGEFDFNIEVTNNLPLGVVFDLWTMVTLPDSSVYGPIIDARNLELAGFASIDRDRTQAVPERAPAGNYTYDAYVGTYPDDIQDEDHFDFEKLPVSDGNAIVHGWDIFGEGFEEAVANLAGVSPLRVETPGQFSLFEAYPNPFNPLTTISYTLPEAARVTLRIFDVNGRQISELANGWRDAGVHEVTFDGSGLTSGLYFCCIETDNFSAVMKMVLMK